MLSADVQRQVKRLELSAGRLVTEALAGNYLSAFKGRGMEFDEAREYIPGDDVRTIDWNVTARTGVPYVKLMREERELTIMVLVDVSPSQAFGAAARAKREVAAELAAVLAFLATRSNDKVGLVAFSDHVEQSIPPKKGRGHVWNIIRTILTHEGQGRRTDVAGALEHTRRVLARRSVVFLLSDFWAEGYERTMTLMARRHDLTAVLVRDPLERELPQAGLVLMEDAETGTTHALDTSDRRVRQAWAERMAQHDAALFDRFKRLGIAHMTVHSDQPVTEPLARYMRERERRRIRGGGRA